MNRRLRRWRGRSGRHRGGDSAGSDPRRAAGAHVARENRRTAADLENTLIASRRTRLINWLGALVVACLASAAVVELEGVLRDVWQVRTLPERVEEWLLLFVPLNLFEQGLGEFGAQAKDYALTVTIVGMVLVLIVIGTLALHAGWRSWRLLAIGIGLWLFAMLVVMPVTGAGFFAAGLQIVPLLTDAGYLVVFLAYASILIVGRLGLGYLHAPGERPPLAERRALLAGLLGTLVAGVVTAIAGRGGGLVTSTLPLAAAPTLVPTPPSTPVAIAGPAPNSPPATTVVPVTPTPGPTPTPVPLPNPPPEAQIARDETGSLTAAGRAKGQLSPPITANSDFYIVTKNAVTDPVVDANTWRLIIDGEVNNPVQLDYGTLTALPPVDIVKTLECISNLTAACYLTTFGCDLLSTARWRGAHLSDVLSLAGGLKSTAVGIAFFSSDEFSAGLPVDVVQDPETVIVYQMNDQPLPRAHGFPARLLVPGRYGMKNPKWLVHIQPMAQEYVDWYGQRGWNPDGIVKTMSRIDTPADGATLPSGEQMVAGIAYAGDRGVMTVELSSDDGTTWEPAQFIEPMQGSDTMVRWQTTFLVPSTGSVTLTVRATDGTGQVQTDDFELPQPDGGSGQDQITVTAA